MNSEGIFTSIIHVNSEGWFCVYNSVSCSKLD